MKKSISYLPKRKQNELNFFVEQIRKRLPEAEMVILYGSYARNEYVERDERDEHGIPTIKISDYDIMVLTISISDKKAGVIFDNIEDLYFKDIDKQTPVQFINDNIKNFNKAIEEGRYFETEIKKEGVILYDSGRFKLARIRKLNFEEIKERAQEYFNDKFDKGNDFLEQAKFAYQREKYVMASFQLHQACENYYYAIRLTFTLKSNKQHNLSKLTASVSGFSPELDTIFPLKTEEDKRLFSLIKAAYVDARYNPHFVVNKEDIDALIPEVELLRDIAKRMCEDKINKYNRNN